MSTKEPNIDRDKERAKADKIYKDREEYREQGQTENTNSDQKGDTKDSEKSEKPKEGQDKQAPNLDKKKDNEQDVKIHDK